MTAPMDRSSCRVMTTTTWPRVAIARIAAVNSKTCEDLSFSPWNGDIADHKPLGVVSRFKRKVYNASRRERHELNGIDDRNIERSR